MAIIVITVHTWIHWCWSILDSGRGYKGLHCGKVYVTRFGNRIEEHELVERIPTALVFFQKSHALTVLSVFNGRITLENGRSGSSRNFWKSLTKSTLKIKIRIQSLF